MIARWLGVYLLTIAALTLFPFIPPACGSSDWTLALLPGDFVMNVLMFIPAGIAVHKTTIGRTAALAFGLSLAIEISQQWLPRNPDFTDLASNTIGALAGRSIARAWLANAQGPMMSLRVEQLLIRGAAALLLTGALAEAVFNPSADFSNWEAFPLVIANDSVGDHGWVGEVSELSIYDRPLGAPAWPMPRPSHRLPWAWEEGAPILQLELGSGPPHAERTTRVRLAGPDGQSQRDARVSTTPAIVETPGALRFEPTRLLLDDVVRDHVLERLRASGQLTLDARIRPLGLHQRGPSHILSFGGVEGANLVLAQDREALIAHIRTPGTVLGGTTPEIEMPKETLTGEEQHVRLSYDGYDAVMFIDGVCVDELKLSIATSFPLLGAMLGGTLVLCCALTTLAIASFYENKGSRIIRGTAGGAVAWLALFALGAWEHVADFDTFALLLGALSIAATVPTLTVERLTPGGPTPGTTSQTT